MTKLLNTILLQTDSFYISIADVAMMIVAIVLILSGYRFASRRLTQYATDHIRLLEDQSKNRRRLLWLVLILMMIAVLLILRLDIEIIPDKDFDLTISRVLLVPFIIILARLLDSIISKRIDEEIHDRQSTIVKATSEQSHGLGVRLVQYILGGLAVYFLLKNFSFLNFSFHSFDVKGTPIDISLSNIMIAILVLLVARLIVWLLTNFFFLNLYKRRDIDLGKQYAYNQLFSYLIYFFGVLFALQFLGINMTLIWTGAAALLVGLGIALQQTISDFFSGIILLFERSVQVGDYLELESNSGWIRRIGLRASSIETRENKTLVIPNSQLVNDRVVNWSTIEALTRFELSIGVAYGSDITTVNEHLLSVAQAHAKISSRPKPFVRLTDFGDSALVFELYFYCNDFINIDDIKSDLRIQIYHQFNNSGIIIPFPQQDVWIHKTEK